MTDTSRHDFARLWAGESISLVGTQVTQLALPLTAVLTLHADAAALGWLGAAAYAPFVVLGAPAGLICDRVRRRGVLIAADVGLTLAVATIPVLAATHALTLDRFLLAAFAIGCLRVFFEVAYRAYLPAIAPLDELARANGRLSVSESFAEMAGPSLAGVLVQVAGAPFALFADAASYLLSAAGLMTIRHREHRPEPPRESWRRQLTTGFRVTWSSRVLRAFAGEAASYNFFWQLSLTVLVLFAVRDLQLSPSTLGFDMAAGAGGALLGALVTRSIASRTGLGATVIGAAVIGDVAPLPLPWIGAHGAAAVLAGLFFIQGIGLTGCNVHAVTIRQRITPHALLGRTNGAYRVLAYGVMPFGALTGGALGDAVGLRTALAVGTIGLLTTALFLVFSPLRGMREIGAAGRLTEPVHEDAADVAVASDLRSRYPSRVPACVQTVARGSQAD